MLCIMARGKGGSKSGSGSSSGRNGRNNNTIGLDGTDQSLIPYEEKILHPSEGQPLAGWNVYAKVSSIDSVDITPNDFTFPQNRIELAEALPYFAISRGSTYIEDDIVRGFLLNDDEDDGAYRGRQG